MTSLKNTNIDTKRLLEWPKDLRTPAELMQALKQETRLKLIKSPTCSKIILQIVGSYAYLVAHVFNKTRIYNKETFDQELRRQERQHDAEFPKSLNGDNTQPSIQVKPTPLITYSNHISCLDDPILWGALFPFNYYSTRTDVIRWSAAAVDICFSKPWHSTFFCLGKSFPIVRGIGVDQPAMEFARALLNHNQWLHMFPEGRVMRNNQQEVISNIDRGYIFKWGISKLILDYFKDIPMSGAQSRETKLRILPFYHLGLDKVLPIGWPYIPRLNKHITILIRHQVIDLSPMLMKSIMKTHTLSFDQVRTKTEDEQSRIKLTNYLEEEMQKLIDPALELHEANKLGKD